MAFFVRVQARRLDKKFISFDKANLVQDRGKDMSETTSIMKTASMVENEVKESFFEGRRKIVFDLELRVGLRHFVVVREIAQINARTKILSAT